jgi:hypothetical protein
MKINRVWAMPNKWTFQIKPIKELLDRYVGDGKGWFDPFAGMTSPAEIKNDLNPESKAEYHLEALDFVNTLRGKTFKGCIFDPPYSLTQVSRSYKDMGKEYHNANDRTGAFTKVRDVIPSLLQSNGIVIYFGWNSNAMGKKRGFEIVEILLVAHGGNRNDTIVTVERKVNGTLGDFEKII